MKHMRLIARKKENGATVFTYVPFNRLDEFKLETMDLSKDYFDEQNARLSVLPCVLKTGLSKEIKFISSLGIYQFLHQQIQILIDCEHIDGKDSKREFFELFRLLESIYDISVSRGPKGWYVLGLTKKYFNTATDLKTRMIEYVN